MSLQQIALAASAVCGAAVIAIWLGMAAPIDFIVLAGINVAIDLILNRRTNDGCILAIWFLVLAVLSSFFAITVTALWLAAGITFGMATFFATREGAS